MPEHIIVGIDEVGRGPLAGPVVAACVYIPDQNLPFLTDATDSKKLSKKTEYLYFNGLNLLKQKYKKKINLKLDLGNNKITLYKN